MMPSQWTMPLPLGYGYSNGSADLLAKVSADMVYENQAYMRLHDDESTTALWHSISCFCNKCRAMDRVALDGCWSLGDFLLFERMP